MARAAVIRARVAGRGSCPTKSSPPARKPSTTNQRMELTAVLEALRTFDGEVHVVSDSTYVVNCFRDGWWKNWLARGWRNARREPVANRDIWEPLVDLVRNRNDVTFQWVKGHNGDHYNDLVDRLAVDATRTQSPRRGRVSEL